MKGRVLIVAGSDSSGGAGIQADIKTVCALDAYAATAVSALTVQNTLGVEDVLAVPPDFVAHQMRAVLDDIGADCIKIGMMSGVDILQAVCQVLEEQASGISLVVDPVLVATSGDSLADEGLIDLMRRRMFPLANLVTPNIPEARKLTDMRIDEPAEMPRAAAAILDMGPGAVLLKGGHLEGDKLLDVLVERERTTIFEDARIDSSNTHGTGCSLASAIAAGLAQGLDLRASVGRARAYVRKAIETAPGLGGGHGPLNHGHTLKSFVEPD